MKRTMFTLFVAAVTMASQAAAADMQTSRSVGAHPVVYDDYPESDVVIDIGPDVVLTVTGEARTRFEWVENATDFSSSGFTATADSAAFDDAYSFAASRYNLGFRFDLPRDVAAVIELQGAFDMGSGPLGLGTELAAQTTQFQRPGVWNAQMFGPGLFRVGGAANSGGGGIAGLPVNSSNGLAVVRTLRDVAANDNVHVYQGYMEAAHIGDSVFSVRAGRQELAYGTEFLLGNQDFYDGQTFDAVKGIFEFSDNARLDLFWAKLAERDTTLPGLQNGDDTDLFGAYFSLDSLGGSSVGMEAYAMNLKDNSNLFWTVGASAKAAGGGYNATSAYALGGTFVGNTAGGAPVFLPGGDSFLDSWWIGVRFFREREHGFHFSAELTYQFGEVAGSTTNLTTGVASASGIDISAWAAETFFGYTWDTPTNPTIKGGITFATGSDIGDYRSGDTSTFFTPAGEVHPRLGMMDLIDASNVLAFNLGYSGSNARHSWGADIWHFQFDEVDPIIQTAFLTPAQIGGAAGVGRKLDDELGQEIDLWYNYQYSEHMAAQFALSYFNAGNFFEDANKCGGPSGAFGAGNGGHAGCDLTAAPVPGANITTSDAWRVYANLLVRF